MSDFHSRTGSSLGVIKANGTIIARPHPVMKKSYSGNDRAAPPTSTMQASYLNPAGASNKALVAYHPNAIRSRLPTTFPNEAKPYKRFCQPRGQHTYDFLSGNTPAGYVRFRTTSQNYYDYDVKALSVGESNQGVVSEKSKWIHSKQTM